MLVLVTGAGSGIGRATALRFAQRRDTVICVDIDEQAARKTATACGDASLAYGVDVADAAAVKALAIRVHADHGTLDVLVNNAGVGMTGRLDEMKIDDWDWIRSINLDGVVHGCHAFAPAMLARGQGHIVNLSSGLGYTPRATEPAYVATKAAVLALSRSLRADWGPRGVTVTAICPGIINTPIIERTAYIGSQESARSSGRQLFSRGHSPDKVAKAIVRTVTKPRAVVPVGVESWGAWMLSRFGPMWLQERIAQQDLQALAPVAEAITRVQINGERSFTVTTDDGATIAGAIAGPEDGRAVVLAHCWTGNRDVWADVSRRLVADGMRVISYDHRGHGASIAGSDAYTLERLAADLAAVLEHTDVTGAVLAGHSIGGMTIQTLALIRPDVVRERVREIVLVASAAHGIPSHLAGRGGQAVVGSQLAQRVMSSVRGDRFARRAFGRTASPEHVAATRQMFAACDATPRRALLAEMHAMDLRALRDIDLPVTVIAGPKDRLTPPKLSRELAGRLGARYLEVPGAGHMLPMEAPDVIASAITSGTSRDFSTKLS